MRIQRVGLVVGSYSLLVAVAGCSGAGSPTSLPVTPLVSNVGDSPVSVNQRTPNASASQQIVAATGGTIVVKSGKSKLSVTVPPHALASNANVAVGIYLQGPPLPSGSAKAPLPAGAQFLGGFSISTGGAALVAPLRATESYAAAPSGKSLRLAMYGSKAGAYVDVDTATAANASVANANDTRYVSISSATGARNPYAFYATRVPRAPVPIALALTALAKPPYLVEKSVGLVASGADANGNPYAFTPAFAISNAALGKLMPSSANPYGVTLAFGNQQQTGVASAADARTKLTAQLNLSVQSQRPANGGDTYAYAGSMTQTFVRTLPSPLPVSRTRANVTTSVTVNGDQTFQGTKGLYDFVTSESDATNLQTTNTTTDAYVGFSSANAGGAFAYLEYGSNWADENGDSLSYVYPQPIVVDRLPNAAKQSWSNTAAATLYENETVGAGGAAFSAQRVYAANGTYGETSTYPPGYFGIGTPSDHGQIQENADGSGYYSVPIYGAGDIVYSAPAGKNGKYAISYSVYAQASPLPTASPLVAATIPAWYPPKPALYRETDVETGMTAIPAACKSSAVFGKRAEQLVQTIDRLDTILGYTEKTTQRTYLISGYGVVCTQLVDVQTSYYDFNGDSQFVFFAQPYQVTTTSETLGLQQSGTNVQGANVRRASAIARVNAYTLIAHSAFTRAIERLRQDRERKFAATLHHLIVEHNGGVR
jgi:hypothetical protein